MNRPTNMSCLSEVKNLVGKNTAMWTSSSVVSEYHALTLSYTSAFPEDKKS